MFRFTIRDLLWVTAVVAILFAWCGPRQPFGFLVRQTPVLADDRSVSGGRAVSRYYAYKSDFDELNRRAAIELRRRGFEFVADDRSFGPRAIQYERRADGGSLTGHVTLFQDMRYAIPQQESMHSVIGHDDAGWVSVQVYLETPPSLLERVRSESRRWLAF
jgi:hypothetical protein